jgi:hypothetical protein
VSLTEDEVRQMLSECVTVVRPGETLLLRCGRDWTPDQAREVQEWMDRAIEWRDLGFKALVVPADELGVVGAGVCHQAPREGDGGLMPCCGLTPFEAPKTDRMTLEPLQVTCKVPSRAPRHLHAAGEPAAEDLFTHMSQAHSMHMTGSGLPDMAKTHEALHAPQQVAANG